MERYAGLLLDVWREVCRHIEIGESIERLGPILMRRLPVDLVLIRRLDPERSSVETVATGRGEPAPPRRDDWSSPEQHVRSPRWSNWRRGAAGARCCGDRSGRPAPATGTFAGGARRAGFWLVR